MSENAISYVAGPAPEDAGRRLRVVADRDVAYEPALDVSSSSEVPGDGAVAPAVALAALRHAADLVARADLDLLDDRGLLEFTVDLDRQTTRLEAQRLRHLGEVDRRAAFTEDACVTAGSWFKLRSRRDPAAGSRLVRFTRRLARFKRLRAAFEAGRITEDHVLVVLRAAKGAARTATLVDHEDTLVALAERGQPRDVKAAVAAICDATDHRDPDGDCGPHDARELYHATTFNGLGDLRGTLDPVTAERLHNLLNAYHAPDRPDTPDDDRRSAAQARHDAFDAILRAAEEHPDIPTVQGAKPHAVVFVDLFTLLGRPDLATRATKLASGRTVDLQQVIHLLEDAKATAVLSLGPYRPVAFGRTHRVLPDRLRPVLAMLHGTCAGPGCDRPVAWTQAAHQQKAWTDGGTTELDTTIPLCPGTDGHHALADVDGWDIDMDPNTRISTWTGRVPAGREEHRIPDRRTIITTHPPDP